MKKMFVYRHCPITLLLLAVFCGNVYALQGSTAENGSNAQAVHELGCTGQGINVGLISARNVRDTHEAFKDKDPNDPNNVHVFNSDYSGSDVNYMGGSFPGHDTWVAGIIASRGWTGHPNDIGVSPDCNLYSARVVNDYNSISTGYVEDALEALINTYNCRVLVTAIALPSPAFGDANGSSSWSLMYDYFAYTNNVIFALASGNGPSTPSIFGDAYNGITTAALIDEPNNFYLRVGNLSNFGPTIDGRKKPEISCPGSSQTTPSIGSNTASYTTVKDGATSFSVPQTGGVAALLLGYADSTTEPNDGHNEVIKAVIVNSTFPNIRDKSGNFTDPANRVWDPNRGYGRIDAYRAYLTLSAGKVAAGTPINSTSGWAYNTLSDSQTHTYFINAQRRERLVLTVTWNRAVTRTRKQPSWPWEYKDEEPNKFNIDITIKDPCDMVVYSEANNVNNLEKIDLILPNDGNYTVVLKNTTSKSRNYGLAFEILPPLTGDFDIDYVVNRNDLNQIAIDWLSAEPDTDIVPDGIVNWLDFTEFADNWLKVDARYYNP
ncbi:MAG: S8 family serine peptidase [Phycisphaerae bacterium]|nr:S8 family serine peptidase [Phycisphaerae bacterium]